MGYESSGSGTFTWRNPEKIKEAISKFNDDGFNVDFDSKKVSIYFSNWKIYRSDAEFEDVLEYCNGEFEIYGDEQGDIWKLIFKDGEVFKATAHIEWNPEEKQESLSKAMGV